MEDSRLVRQLTLARGKNFFQDAMPLEWEQGLEVKQRKIWKKEVERKILTEFGNPHEGPIEMEKQPYRYVKFGLHIHEWKKRRNNMKTEIKTELATPKSTGTDVSDPERRCSSQEHTGRFRESTLIKHEFHGTQIPSEQTVHIKY